MKLKPQKLYSKLHLMSIYAFIVLLMCLNFHLVHGNNSGFLILNKIHSPFFDTFFKYYTNFGDGLVWLLLLIVCFFYYKKRMIIVFANFVISTLLAQFLKHVFFSNSLRPAFLVKEGYPVHFAEGVKIYTQNSFPSGHTITAFAVAFTIIILLKRKSPLKYLVSVMAFLVAFSRVYLAQHFPIDVIAGAFLGISSTFITIYILSLFKASRPSIFIEEVPEKKTKFELINF